MPWYISQGIKYLHARKKLYVKHPINWKYWIFTLQLWHFCIFVWKCCGILTSEDAWWVIPIVLFNLIPNLIKCYWTWFDFAVQFVLIKLISCIVSIVCRSPDIRTEALLSIEKSFVVVHAFEQILFQMLNPPMKKWK